MAKKLNKNLVIGLTVAGVVVTTLAGVLMVSQVQQTDPEEIVRRAEEFSERKEYNRAATFFIRAYNASKDPIHLVRAGDMAYEQGDEMRALGAYNKAADADPQLLEAQEKILDIRLEIAELNPASTENWVQLNTVADAILKLEGQTEHPRAMYAKGLALTELKDINPENEAKGVEHLVKAVELDPRNSRYARKLADYYFQNKQEDRAVEVVRRVVENATTAGENAAKSRCYLALYLRSEQQHDEALSLLTEALALSGDDAETKSFVHAQTGFYWSEVWRNKLNAGEDDVTAYESAKAAFEKAVETHPDTFDAYLSLAELLARKEKYAEAIELCENRLAGTFQREGLQAFRTRVKRYSLLLAVARLKVVLAQNESAGTDARDKLAEEATMYVDDALAEISNGAEAFHVRGRILAIQGRDLDAIRAYERSDELSRVVDPINLLYLAESRFNQNQLGAAREAVTKAMSSPRAPTAAWLMYARILLRLDDPNEALSVVNNVLQRDPGNRDALMLRAASQEALGQTVTGLDEMDAPMVVAAVAAKRAQEGDYQGALDKVLPALAQNPADRYLVRTAAAIYGMQERPEDVNRVIDAAVKAAADPYEFEILRLQLDDTLSVEQKQARQKELIQSTADEYVRAIRTAAFLEHTDKNSAAQQLEQLTKAKQLIIDRGSDAARQAGDAGLRTLVDRMIDLAQAVGDNDRVDALIDEAVARNLDAADGRSYRGRRLIAEGFQLDLQASAAEEKGDKAEASRLRDEAQKVYGQAIETLQKALEAFPNNGMTLAAMGDAYLQNKRINEARSAYQRCDDLMPNNPTIVKQLARLAQYVGDEAAHQKRIEQLKTLAPDDPWVADQILALEESQHPREGIAKREKLRQQNPADLANLRALARLYRTVGDFDQAAGCVEQIVTSNPELSAVYFAAPFLRSINREDRALEILAERLRAAQGEDKHRLQLLIGNHFQEIGNLQQAERAYLAAAEQDANHEVCMTIAQFYFGVNENQKADEWATKGRELAAASESAMLPLIDRFRIENYLALGDRARARELCDDYVARYPDDKDGSLLDAKVASEFGEIDVVISKLDRHVLKYPRDFVGLYMRAWHLASIGDWPRAIRDLEQVRAGAPDIMDFAPRMLLSRAYAKVDRIDMAYQELENVVRDHPEADNVALQLLRLYMDREKYAEADKVVTAMYNRKPDDVRWLVEGAELAAKQEDSKRAIGNLTRAATLSGFMPQVTSRLLSAHREFGAVEEGIAFFENQIPPDRRTPMILVAYGSLQAARGDIGAALETFRIASMRSGLGDFEFDMRLAKMLRDTFGANNSIRLFETPPSEEMFIRPNQHILAALLFAESKYDRCIEVVTALMEGVESDEEKSGLLLLQAMSLENLEKYAEARGAYEQVLTVRENSLIALNNLAYMLSDVLGQPELALPYAKRAAALSPSAPVLDTLGWVHVKLGQYGDAIAKLGLARRKDPTFVTGTYHLGEAYRLSGKFDEAIKLFREILREDIPEGSPDFKIRQQAEEALKQAEQRSSE